MKKLDSEVIKYLKDIVQEINFVYKDMNTKYDEIIKLLKKIKSNTG